MFLLYADESGTVHDAKQQTFVLAGFCVFERQGFWIANELDKIAARFNPADPASVELHGNPMHSGKGIFRQFPKEDRLQAIEDALKVFLDSHPSNRLFASVVNKALISPVDPVEYAFEQLASRFDHYLTRLHKAGNTQRGVILFDNTRLHKAGNTQRGVILFDKSTYETTLQALATDFRTIGHSWGVLRNLSEVPLFMDSKASRLIQLADLIAYAIFRNYERGDADLFSIIQHRFDAEGGITHGLHVRI